MSLTRTTSAMVTDGGIQTEDLADLSVTFPKWATGPANTVVQFGADGRPFAAATAISDGSVVNSHVADYTLTLSKFAAGTPGSFLRFDPITGALGEALTPLADLSVTASKIALGAVGTSQLADGAVTNQKLANNSVSTAKMFDASVTNQKVAPGVLTLDRFAPGPAGQFLRFDPTTGNLVSTNSLLADKQVTLNKLADGTPGKWLKYDELGRPIETDPPASANDGYFNVKEYGAKGDGVTNDAAAFQAAIDAAKAARGTVFVPEGKYVISGLAAQSGRLFILGDGDAQIVGSITYTDLTFPPVADSSTPISPDAPYVSISGLSFAPTGSAYGLTIEAQQTGSYIQVGEVRDCAFYGRWGMLVRHAITFDLVNCHFHNTEYGLVMQGSTNCNVVECGWHNIAGIATWLTSAPVGQDSRMGGENIRFTNCDWGVCSTAVRCDNHNYLRLTNCLIDYCGLALDLRGSSYGHSSGTYFGSSSTHVGALAQLAGYAAPIQQLCVRGVPTTSYGTRPCGMVFEGCKFVEYQSTTTPNIRIDGTDGGMVGGRPCAMWGFSGCTIWKYNTDRNHEAPTLMDIKAATEVFLANNIFYSPNGGAGYIEAYKFTDCMGVRVWNNIFHHSRKDSMATIVGSVLENSSGTLRPFNPGGAPDIVAVLKPAAMDGATPTFARGIDFTMTNLTTNVAMALTSTQWLEWAGNLVLGKNGTTTELKSNGHISFIDGNVNRSSATPAIKIDSSWNGNPVHLYLTGKLRRLGLGPHIDSTWSYVICERLGDA